MILSSVHNDAVTAAASSDAASVSDYLLVCDARSTAVNYGHWRFALETAEGESVFDAEDEEEGDLNRLTLLAAVRGLESIEGPSSVTLISNNRYLIRSLTDSLPRWRENNFVWEHFGSRVDVQHADLWRRIDGALSIHHVEAVLISSRVISGGENAGQGRVMRRVDSPHAFPSAPKRRRVPADRLRRWLMSGTGTTTVPPRQRFDRADLAEAS